MADTLLDIVQGILVEMSSDAVNSISDTIESEDVAKIVQTVYKEMVHEFDLPGKKDIRALDGLGDTDKPNYMQIPADISKILWIKYDCRAAVSDPKAYRTIPHKDPADFIEMVNSRDSTDTTNNKVVQHSANIPLVIAKLQAPSYWTSFDDDYIVFDSYDSVVDSTLQTSKSMCEVYEEPSLTIDDATVPDLPDNLIPVLYTQALNRCMVVMKTTLNPKTERNENRLRVRSQRNKWRQGRVLFEGPDWGRRR